MEDEVNADSDGYEEWSNVDKERNPVAFRSRLETCFATDVYTAIGGLKTDDTDTLRSKCSELIKKVHPDKAPVGTSAEQLMENTMKLGVLQQIKVLLSNKYPRYRYDKYGEIRTKVVKKKDQSEKWALVEQENTRRIATRAGMADEDLFDPDGNRRQWNDTNAPILFWPAPTKWPACVTCGDAGCKYVQSIQQLEKTNHPERVDALG